MQNLTNRRAVSRSNDNGASDVPLHQQQGHHKNAKSSSSFGSIKGMATLFLCVIAMFLARHLFVEWIGSTPTKSVRGGNKSASEGVGSKGGGDPAPAINSSMSTAKDVSLAKEAQPMKKAEALEKLANMKSRLEKTKQRRLRHG